MGLIALFLTFWIPLSSFKLSAFERTSLELKSGRHIVFTEEKTATLVLMCVVEHWYEIKLFLFTDIKDTQQPSMLGLLQVSAILWPSYPFAEAHFK